MIKYGVHVCLSDAAFFLARYTGRPATLQTYNILTESIIRSPFSSDPKASFKLSFNVRKLVRASEEGLHLSISSNEVFKDYPSTGVTSTSIEVTGSCSFMQVMMTIPNLVIRIHSGLSIIYAQLFKKIQTGDC